MFVIKNTRTCPHCGAFIDSENALVSFARFRLGSPLRLCLQCRKYYRDAHFKEWKDVTAEGRFWFKAARIMAGVVFPAPLLWILLVSLFDGSATLKLALISITLYACGVAVTVSLIWWNMKRQIQRSMERSSRPPMILE